jgi:hypothetical protein
MVAEGVRLIVLVLIVVLTTACPVDRHCIRLPDGEVACHEFDPKLP